MARATACLAVVREIAVAWTRRMAEEESDRTADDIARERAELRVRFGRAYDDLLALLLEEDPCGINFGHNADEYDPEVRTILPRLGQCRSSHEVQAVLHEEFCRWFDAETAGPLTAYERIAKRIVAELPELLGRAG